LPRVGREPPRIRKPPPPTRAPVFRLSGWQVCSSLGDTAHF